MSVQSLCRNPNIRFAAALLAVAGLIACGHERDEASDAREAHSAASVPAPKEVASAPAEMSNGPYGIKAGMYEMKMPMNMKMTTYFDDNGKKTATYSEMGGKVMAMTYNMNDGWMVSCVPMTKTCTKTKVEMGSAPMPMSAPAADRKAIESMDLAGKKCEGWQVTAAGVTSKVWMYKGIPCKTEAAGQVMETTKISDDAPPADKMALPAGYKQM